MFVPKLFVFFKSLLFALVFIIMTNSVCFAHEEKPVNFIFLLDVSGSMVSRTTMVKDANGKQITLFESLRRAIKDIVADKRLIKVGSRVCFITFGTEVAEKKNWPQKILNGTDREKLIEFIEDSENLKADRIGDTYMGGALNLALAKATKFREQSDPCTTTFILMLTDGWDEPPKDAKYDVRDMASKVVLGQRQAKEKVGIDTWQIAVVGLKRLPRLKEGTTTASELSSLLNGTFLDVTQEKGSSVSKKIYKALSKILLNQRGEFKLVQTDSSGVVNFGEIQGGGEAQTTIEVELSACDEEEISSVKLSDEKIDGKQLSEIIEQINAISSGAEKITPLSDLESGALSVTSEKPKYTVVPMIDENGKRSPQRQSITLHAKAGSKLPVGRFVGCLKLISTAKVPTCIPFIISAPARLTTSEDEIKVQYKRKGFLQPEVINGKISVDFMQAKGSQEGAVYKISARIKSLTRVKRNGKPKKPLQKISAEAFNNGKPIDIKYDTSSSSSKNIEIPFEFPRSVHPGIYKGVVSLDIDGPPEMVAPKEIPVTIVVKPNEWEQVAPIAIPMLLLLGFGIVVYVYYSLKSKRR